MFSKNSQPFVEDNLVISKKKRGGRPCKPLIKGKQENVFKSNDRTFISNNIDYSNEEFKFFSNASELELPAQTLSKMSTLPETYPPYFKYQLPPKAVFTQSLIPSQPNIMTPDDTPKSFELKDSTSTSPSLSESLQGIFDTDDLRHLLNIEKVSYRLYEYHVQVLAVVLNLQVDYLHDLLDKILKINPNALRKVNNALKTPFVPDHDIFEMKNSDNHSQEELS